MRASDPETRSIAEEFLSDLGTQGVRWTHLSPRPSASPRTIREVPLPMEWMTASSLVEVGLAMGNNAGPRPNWLGAES